MDKINDIKIDKNFSLKEFECPCCKRVILHSDLLKNLIKLRSLIREPIYINSGYRCKEYNTQVGGVKGSYHLFGMAIDISVKYFTIHDLAIQAELVGFKGIGEYSNFLHVDIRPTKYHWEG